VSPRRFARVVTGLLLGTLLGSLFVAGPGAADVTSPPEMSAALRSQIELSIRKTFGLTTDPTIIAMAAASASNGSLESYGVALTDTELADLTDRFAKQPAIGKFSEAAHGLDGYAGFWVDQAAGAMLVLMTRRAERQSQMPTFWKGL
jgi:hypothetical protein